MKVAAPAPQADGPLFPIQVVPPGLLGLLQLKQLGRLPDKLTDTVAGVIELRDWFLTARRVETLTLFPTIPTKALATGNNGNQLFQSGAPPANCVVPQNQIWWVEELSVDVVNTGAMVATDLIRFAPEIVNNQGNVFLLTGPDVSDYILAARTRVMTARCDRGFWAFPGDGFAIRVFDVVTTNGYTATMHLRATPCPI